MKQPHPAKTCLSAWIYPGLGCDALSHPHSCLRTCIPFTHFSLGPSLKTIGYAPHPLGPALPTSWPHLYCCNYAMKPDGRRANHITIEKSWPNRTKTLIISVKLQPNVIHGQLGVISVRNRISRLKKLCIIKPIWRIRHFVVQQLINAWQIRPRMPLKLYIVYMYSDVHV